MKLGNRKGGQNPAQSQVRERPPPPPPLRAVDPLDKLPALAERLGVKEGADGTDGLFLQLRDGRRYAVIDLALNHRQQILNVLVMLALDRLTSSTWAGRFKAIGTMQGEIARLHAMTSGRVHDVVRAALIIMAWNTIVGGRRGTKKDMTWAPTEDFPVIAE